MAWNPTPEIAALRDFAAKFNRPIVVMFSLAPDGNRFHIETYGKTKQLCKLAGAFGDEIAKRVGDGTIAAPELEPGNVAESQVWERVASSSRKKLKL